MPHSNQSRVAPHLRPLFYLVCLLTVIVALGASATKIPVSAQEIATQPAGLPNYRIAFLTSRHARTGIAIMNADGSEIHELVPQQDGIGAQGATVSPDGKQIAFESNREGKFYIYIANIDGSDVRRLTSEDTTETDAAWRPNGKQLAFVSHENGKSIIKVSDADGKNLRALTQPSDSNYAPKWSSKGNQIVFVSNRDIRNSYANQIYVMNADGSNQRRLSPRIKFNEGNPEWSADGRHIVFQSGRDGNWDIFIMNPDGSNARNLTKTATAETGPSWSPDSKQIIYSMDMDGLSQLFIMDVDGTHKRALVSNSNSNGSASFTPDGKQIIYTTSDYQANDIYIMAADGINQKRLTKINKSKSGLSASPNGKYIAFSQFNGNNNDLYILDIEKGTLTALTTDANVGSYSWSPDSASVAYSANLNGKRQSLIFVAKSDGTGITQLTDGTASEGSVIWSQDGQSLFFVSDRQNPKYEIYRMKPDGSAIKRLTNNPEGNYGPKLMPNGKTIVFTSRRIKNNPDLFVMDIAGGDQQRLAFFADMFDFKDYSFALGNHGFTPDSNSKGLAMKMIFDNSRGGIFLMDVDFFGWIKKRLVYADTQVDTPQFAPDGNSIWFSSFKSGKNQLYQMNTDGTNVTQITHDSDNSDFTFVR